MDPTRNCKSSTLLHWSCMWDPVASVCPAYKIFGQLFRIKWWAIHIHWLSAFPKVNKNTDAWLIRETKCVDCACSVLTRKAVSRFTLVTVRDHGNMCASIFWHVACSQALWSVSCRLHCKLVTICTRYVHLCTICSLVLNVRHVQSRYLWDAVAVWAIYFPWASPLSFKIADLYVAYNYQRGH